MALPELRIRPFTTTDQTPVRQLILTGLGDHFGYINETLNPDLEDITAHYLALGHIFVVAETGGELVGTGALVTETTGVGRIVRMSVAPQYRRQGIGRTLVTYLVNLARQRGLTRLLVETNNDWYDAIGLYQHCGFIEYDRDEESVYLGLDLGPVGLPITMSNR